MAGRVRVREITNDEGNRLLRIVRRSSWTVIDTGGHLAGGVKLVISDAHPGLKNAIEKVFQGSAWQRCKVHLMRNLMTHVPKSHKQMIGATVRTIFVQPDTESTRTTRRLT